MFDGFPTRSSDVAYRMVGDEAILVSASSGRILSLNAVGARIWQLADGALKTSAIISVICNDFDVSEAKAYSDCIEFLSLLIDKGALTLLDAKES